MDIMTLNDQDREVLQTILRKERHELTVNDKIILSARRDYVLSPDWKRLMAEEEKVELKVNKK